MRKIVRIMLAVIISTIAVFAMTACSEKEYTGVSVGVGHYSGSGASLAYAPTVIEATVTVDASGTVLEVKFDEIFHPIDAATPQATDAEAEEGYIVSIGDTLYYQYLSIGGVIFTAQDNEGVFAGYKGTVNGTERVFGTVRGNGGYLDTQEGAQWYYDAYKAGQLFYAKKTGDANPVATTKKFETKNNAGSDSMRKRNSGYWPATPDAETPRLGIMANYEALETYFVENGFDKIPTGTWSLSDGFFKDTASVSTGATMTDTPKYVKVAKAAYDAAVAQTK